MAMQLFCPRLLEEEKRKEPALPARSPSSLSSTQEEGPPLFHSSRIVWAGQRANVSRELVFEVMGLRPLLGAILGPMAFAIAPWASVLHRDHDHDGER